MGFLIIVVFLALVVGNLFWTRSKSRTVDAELASQVPIATMRCGVSHYVGPISFWRVGYPMGRLRIYDWGIRVSAGKAFMTPDISLKWDEFQVRYRLGKNLFIGSLDGRTKFRFYVQRLQPLMAQFVAHNVPGSS